MKKLGIVAAALGCMVSTAYGASGGDPNAKCEDALNKANYKVAGAACRAAMEATKGSDTEVKVRALINMAVFYSDRGQDSQASPLIQQAIQIETNSSGGSAMQARNLMDLGVLLQQEARYDEAEASFKRALEIQEKRAPGSTDMATTLTFLGVLLREQHKFDKATPYFQRALDIDEKKLGAQDPTTVIVRNDLADVTEQSKTSPIIRYNNTPQVVEPAGGTQQPSPPVLAPTAPAAAAPSAAPIPESPAAPAEAAPAAGPHPVAPSTAPAAPTTSGSEGDNSEQLGP